MGVMASQEDGELKAEVWKRSWPPSAHAKAQDKVRLTAAGLSGLFGPSVSLSHFRYWPDKRFLSPDGQ